MAASPDQAAAKGKRRADASPIHHLDDTRATDLNDGDDGDGDELACLICLGDIQDRTVLPECAHSLFCFACIVRWAEVRRRCPLCARDVGPYVVHAIRTDDDFLRYFLRPAPEQAEPAAAAVPSTSTAVQRLAARSRRRRVRQGPVDDETALERRRDIYARGLYVRHVGSNRHTGYRRRRLDQDPEERARIAAFVRRDLSAAAPSADVEFLTTYIMSLIRATGGRYLRDDSAQERLADFVGPRTAAHLAHELDAFVRSGKRRLADYDSSPWVQYADPTPARTPDTRSVSEVPDNRDRNGDEAPTRSDVAQRRERLLARLEAERRELAARQAADS